MDTEPGAEADFLTPYISDRGLRYMPPIANKFGTTVEVYDSSAASETSVWLRIRQTSGDDSHIGLSVDDARRFAAQIDAMTSDLGPAVGRQEP